MDARNISEEDFYTLLGCNETSSAEQISTEFKLLARKHHPDKVSDLDGKEAAEKHFILLKRAKEVLLDADMRQKYDQWRAGFRMWINFDDWLKMQSRVHTSIHWATTTQKMPSLEQGGTSVADSSSVWCNTNSTTHQMVVDEGGERDGGSVGGEGEEGGGGGGERDRGSAGGGGDGRGEGGGGEEVPQSLQQFRRGSGRDSKVSKFRNYKL